MIDNLGNSGKNFPTQTSTAYGDANRDAGTPSTLTPPGPKFSPYKSPSKYIRPDPGLAGADTHYNETYQASFYSPQDSPNKYNDFVKTQNRETKAQVPKTGFVQNNISEAKDRYVAQELSKPPKTRNLREKSSNVKPEGGDYDTTYGEYYKKKNHVRIFGVNEV